MKAIIPAAGVGTRLRPHTYSIPKILLNVAGKPMISHIIDELITVKELDKIIIIVGHLADKVEEYMFDLDAFISQKNSSIGVKDVDDPSRFGVVETGKDGFITRMIEKPSGPDVTPSKKAIAGIYLIQNSDKLFKSIDYIIKNNVRTKNEYQLTDALQNMIKVGEKFTIYDVNWFDCGKPETLLSANKYLLEKNFANQKVPVFPGTLIIPPVAIGENCKIVNSIIGPDTTIGSGSQIKDSIIKNSTVGDNSTIEASLLEDSIIGNEVNITGNYRRLYIGDSTDITF